MLWFPLEIIKKSLNITSSKFDQELTRKSEENQSFIERKIFRNLNGNLTKTEYLDGTHNFLRLSRFPIISFDTLKVDVSREFGSDSLVDASDYFFDDDALETGLLYLRSGIFPDGESIVQAIYKGGYIPLLNVVEFEAPSATNTIADSLVSYGQGFDVYLKTTGTFTAPTDSEVDLTGTDENGDAQTESVKFTSSDLTTGVNTFVISSKKWKSVTIVDSTGLGTGGTIQVSADSFPDDLKLALQLLVVHFFSQDEDQTQGFDNLSGGGFTKSGIVNEVPSEVEEILKLRRAYY